MASDEQPEIELTVPAPPLEKYSKLFENTGLNVETLKQLSEPTIFAALTAAGVAPGDACELKLLSPMCNDILKERRCRRVSQHTRTVSLA